MSPHETRLKVLHIASGDRWGGAEAQLFTLLSQLQQDRGLELLAVLLNDGELAARLRQRGIDVTVFDESSLGGLAILQRLHQLMETWRPQIVHTHRQKENVLGSIANRFSARAPSVRTSHGAPEHRPQGLRQLHKQVFGWLDDWCAHRWQDRIIAVSQDLGGLLARRFPPERITVIENGVDLNAVQSAVAPVDFRQREPGATHVGLVGRLDRVKRVDLFLEMAALLQQAQPERQWRFHVFGDGKLRVALEEQARALGIAPSTRFHGHRDDIIPCLAGLDALVMCSDHEGLPMTALESLVVGTPIIANNVGGLTEVLDHCDNGLLVDEHSPAAYRDAVIRILQSRASKSARPELDIKSQFKSTTNARRTAELYRSLDSGAR